MIQPIRPSQNKIYVLSYCKLGSSQIYSTSTFKHAEQIKQVQGNISIAFRYWRNLLIINSFMRPSEQQQQPLSFGEKDKNPLFSDKQPPPLTNRIRRPWKGIFLSYFLFFCGLLFFTHGIHKFQTFSFWDLLAVWSLSALLLIPGIYFSILIFLIEIKAKGFNYKNHPQLYQ